MAITIEQADAPVLLRGPAGFYFQVKQKAMGDVYCFCLN